MRVGIVPAAGSGVRFSELGKSYPKAILPLREKPIIVHTLEWMFSSGGCDRVVVVVGHQSRKVEDVLATYFGDELAAGKLRCVAQSGEKKGLSVGLLAATERLADDEEALDSEVLVVLGDVVPSGEAPVLHSRLLTWLSVQRVPDFSRWCMVHTGPGTATVRPVVGLSDKPQERPTTDFAASGVYGFPRLDALNAKLEAQVAGEPGAGGEYQLSAVLSTCCPGSGLVACTEPAVTDFGTLREFLDNKGVKKSRSFNEVRVEKAVVTKSSCERPQKLVDEVNWFHNLPDDMQPYAPRLLGSRSLEVSKGLGVSYTMEHVHSPTLRELALFLDRTPETWRAVFSSVREFLDASVDNGLPNTFLVDNVEKTRKRAAAIDIHVVPKLVNDFLARFEEATKVAARKARFWSVMHGDLCFSNVLFDPSSGTIKLVDPRGELFGDARYDLAKLAHSAVCGYDYVDAEMYRVEPDGKRVLYDEHSDAVRDEFFAMAQSFLGDDEEMRYLHMLTASLFLSMIPLHSHNRTNQAIYYDIFERMAREETQW